MAEKKKDSWVKRHKILTVVLVIVGLIIVAGVAGGGSETQSPNQQTTTPEAPAATPAPEKWDVEAAYAKVNNGMSKAEVEAATGKSSDNCTESAIEGIGTSELCTYGGFSDSGQIMVTYSNGAVSSKTKTKY